MRWAFASAVATLALLPASASAESISANNNLDNNGAGCTLREAVNIAVANFSSLAGCTRVANGDPVRDTINLSVDDHELELSSTDEAGNVNGDIDVGAGGPITIQGSGQLILEAGPVNDRVFELTNAASDLTLRDVRVKGGDSSALTDTLGGNIKATSPGNALALDNVHVSHAVGDSGAGIAITGSGSELRVVDSKIGLNTALLSGGGIYTSGSVDTTILRSELDENKALNNVDGNGGVAGGAISDSGDKLTIEDSWIHDNKAQNGGMSVGDSAEGGAIAADGETYIRRSLIATNSATAADTDVTSYERGGGIHASGGGAMEPVEVYNSTLYSNIAGDASSDGEGGGAYNAGPGPLRLTHVTFSANNATVASGGDHVYAIAAATLPTARLRASILPGPDPAVDPCAGAGVTSVGHNVAENNDHDCYFDFMLGDSVSTAPTGLVGGPPAANGGFTDTIALIPGSRSADLVPSCPTAGGTDQRGISRPQGSGCDAGAFELECTTPSNLPGCPPIPPLVTPAAIAATPPAAATKKKCKKGRKLRKGKCRKKKKKKK